MNCNAFERVRTLPASSTAPSTTEMIGLIDSIEPSSAGAADATALLQVLERVERGEQPLTAPTVDDLARDRLDVGAFGGAPRGVQREVADSHRRALRVDDLDRAESVECLGRDLRRLHRRREPRRQVDAHDAVGAVGVKRAERLFERTDRRRRGLGKHRTPSSCCQKASVVSSLRSTYSRSPNRIVSGTTSMPSCSQTSGGRSQALSVTTRTAMVPPRLR